MADNNIPAYPLMFDPSQWLNKYSPYPGQSVPWGQYSGTPTDAMGRPIQSYLDAQGQAAAAQAAPPQQAPPVTLNSTPASLAALMQTPQGRAAYAEGTAGPPHQISAGGQYTGGGGQGVSQLAGTNTPAQYSYGAAPQQQQAPQAAAPAGPDMNAAYLAALANPGKVKTPGATVPQSPTPSNQSGVLQQFLQNWQNKGSPTQGAGNYNNAGFFNALQGQV